MPDLALYNLAWADEFSRLSISGSTSSSANWYSGQPWGGGFGSASFRPPSVRLPLHNRERRR